MEARVLMLSSGSGCSPMTSSPLISPRLWESRLTLLKVWRPPRPSGRGTCAGHLWRWWVVYAPNFPGSTTWLCEPPLACLFPCHSCAFHTLSRDLQVWRRGYLVPLAFRRSSMFPEGNVPGYVCNPGSPRERDAASQGHTSSIPTRAMLHSWKLAPAAHHVLLASWSWRHRTWRLAVNFDWLHIWFRAGQRWWRSPSVSTQRLVPSGNQGYIRNLGRFRLTVFGFRKYSLSILSRLSLLS